MRRRGWKAARRGRSRAAEWIPCLREGSEVSRDGESAGFDRFTWIFFILTQSDDVRSGSLPAALDLERKPSDEIALKPGDASCYNLDGPDVPLE